jgi:hypothetical protein
VVELVVHVQQLRKKMMNPFGYAIILFFDAINPPTKKIVTLISRGFGVSYLQGV